MNRTRATRAATIAADAYTGLCKGVAAAAFLLPVFLYAWQTIFAWAGHPVTVAYRTVADQHGDPDALFPALAPYSTPAACTVLAVAVAAAIVLAVLAVRESLAAGAAAHPRRDSADTHPEVTP